MSKFIYIFLLICLNVISLKSVAMVPTINSLHTISNLRIAKALLQSKTIQKNITELAYKKNIEKKSIESTLNIINQANQILGGSGGFVKSGFIGCLNIYRPKATENSLKLAKANGQGIIKAYQRGEHRPTKLLTVGTQSMISHYAKEFQVAQKDAKIAVCKISQNGHCKMFKTGHACL